MAYSNDPPAVATQRPPDSQVALVVVPLAVGAAVAVALGAYGRLHEPTGFAVNVAGFSGPQDPDG
jgi:hypothetical protein